MKKLQSDVPSGIISNVSMRSVYICIYYTSRKWLDRNHKMLVGTSSGITDKLKALSLLYISGLPSLQQWVHTGFLIHVRYKKIPSGS